MSAAKKAMIEQLNSADVKSVENALFVLSMEPELSTLEIEAIANVLDHKNEDTSYAALMVLIGESSLTKTLQTKVLGFLNAPDEEVQEAVAKYMYDSFTPDLLDLLSEEESTPLPLEVGELAFKYIEKSSNEGALFYLISLVSDFDMENESRTKVFFRFLDGSFNENIQRLTLPALARRPGLTTAVIDKIHKLFKETDNPGIKMSSANILSQCDEASEEIRKETISFFKKPSGLNEALKLYEEQMFPDEED